jgi:hypothetical protein
MPNGLPPRGPCPEADQRSAISLAASVDRRPAIRTLRGWAISVLQEAGAIRECEEHGWMQDRADPHARERAFVIRPTGSAARINFSCNGALFTLARV